MYHDLSLLIAAGLYACAAVVLAMSIHRSSRRLRLVAIVCTFVGVAIHAFTEASQWLGTAPLDASILNLLSLSTLTITLLVSLSVFAKHSLFDAGLIILPLAALALLLEWGVSGRAVTLDETSPGTLVHIVSSVVAFGVLSIAAVYAVSIALCDHFLRNHHLNHLVTALPPLESLERLLFQLIGAGFVLLSISLGSGLVYVNDLFAQHLAHKTTLSILAWLLFGVLLLGRLRYGWRGRYAVRLTLAGIVLLLLAYFGSKFILENLLGRSWRS